VGGGGHAISIAEMACPGGRVIGIDRDAEAIEQATRRLRKFGDCVVCLHGNFVEMDSLVGPLKIGNFDGILMDLGFSSMQVEKPERGFSFMREGPLDMRMDTRQALTAHEIVNKWSEAEIARVLREYGEERWWKRISRAIVATRSEKPIETTTGLSEIVETAVPSGSRSHGTHPATRVFQGLRIAVNGELEGLGIALPKAIELLDPGARLVVISYHSLEDRIAKRIFAQHAKGCICPPDFPVCRCGRQPVVRIVTKRVVTPGIEEIEENPRSRSAKMRVCERLRTG
jgi:16S rRNA (cytosine1402-N4)-methyltransferase